MTRLQALILVVLSYLMLSFGLAWEFGPYGLIGSGVAALVALFVSDVKEE